MTSTSEQTPDRADLAADLAAGLQRLAAQSRVRLAAVEALREQHRLIAEHSRRRLEASRLLLERSRPAVATVDLAEQSRAPRARVDRDGDGDSSGVEDDALQERLDLARQHVAEQRARGCATPAGGCASWRRRPPRAPTA